MTSKLGKNKTRQDSTEVKFSTPPDQKMGNYLNHTSESNKQGSEIARRYIPFSNNQEMSSHNLMPKTPFDSRNNQELTGLPNEKIAVDRSHQPSDTLNWYSDQIETQSNKSSTDNSTKFAQS